MGRKHITSLAKISENALLGEQIAVNQLLPLAGNFQDHRDQIYQRATGYVKKIRANLDKNGIEGFINEYGLDTSEGVMIMCLAESLLRIPDKTTADALIKDKIKGQDWQKHLGGDSFLLNSASWGLMLTGKVIDLDYLEKNSISGVLGHLVNRVGEPIIRTAINKAMEFLGTQFVIGETVKSALKKSNKLQEQGYLFSFDMLGEGARTMEQAEQFYQSYMDAITTIGKQNISDKAINLQAGISIKLSALHPRYEALQQARIIEELLPKLKELFKHACDNNMAVSIDGEESARLDLSLEIFTALISDPDFKGYNGIGFVVQAYQKRGYLVIQYLIELAEKYNKTIPIRLVKGAYWDSEIKWAQELGLEGYPVFTRKSHTDLSYFACANIMLDNIDKIYPQFATHNALTVAGILEVAESKNISDSQFEFQRLYGMGESFYNQMVDKRSIRIYAPIGRYDELLPYLIRRLLENGANSSFVNMVVDEDEPLSKLLRNPVNRAEKQEGTPNPEIPLPKDIYDNRKNSLGVNLGYSQDTAKLYKSFEKFKDTQWSASSLIDANDASKGKTHKILCPYDNAIEVGSYIEASKKQTLQALSIATQAFVKWNYTPLKDRCDIIGKIADLLAEKQDETIALLIREAGKTISDAISETREAIDFCRYYSAIAQEELAAKDLQSPTGESNQLTYTGRGIFACISPWNFPLAIFTGQIIAALTAGNSVIAKPAAQTPLIAYFIVKLMHDAGIPTDVLQLVIGGGKTVGETLIHSSNVAGIAFTGSTAVAKHIDQSLAARNAPIGKLIAETGGQNCMIIDSSALPEQAVDDIIISAFSSAGQRCSALRVAFIQDDIADKIIELLKGAMAELKIGSPEDFSNDLGPVIDHMSQKNLLSHINKMKKSAKFIAKAKLTKNNGSYIAPHAFEIKSISTLKEEVFGPMLHVIRYKAGDIDDVITQINSTGFGLTCGIHSRINQHIDYIKQRINAGNIYINRSMIGATVGVQPFGGMGLSGTGPKAGGPHYLHSFSSEKTITINTAAIGGNIKLLS